MNNKMSDKEYVSETVSEMTLEEKARMITGYNAMSTAPIERLNIESKEMADASHGLRLGESDGHCVHFPNLCLLGCTWDKDAAYKMGKALAEDCIKYNRQMILGPGINIKRHILCGRNFEYLSEDPLLAGELAAGYINGLQEMGVSACVKHFAANNQETNREDISVEVDERTMREIYLRAFEIAVKKSRPDAVMCSYNKWNAIWTSENKMLLNDILKEEWGFDGAVISDWGAVHSPHRAISAGLDLIMPQYENVAEDISDALDRGTLEEERLNDAVGRVLKTFQKPRPEERDYNRAETEKAAREVAASGIVLLKNENNALPLSGKKYRKVAVTGEYAVSPLICGQGSAEVRQNSEHILSPLDEIKKQVDDVEFKYIEMYKKCEFSASMIWPKSGEYMEFISDSDAVMVFAGSMESEDTEMFDRTTARINPNQEYIIDVACRVGKPVIVVLQSGGALVLGDWYDKVSAVVYMGLGGETAGGAVADVLSGKVNPSGKLAETFPRRLRTDIDMGDGTRVIYKEALEVGYRYYDKHPEEIRCPFGHGLSYTDFEYSDCTAEFTEDKLHIEFCLKNTGEYDGGEVVQIYIGNPSAVVSRPVKELRAFEKIMLKSGQTQKVSVDIPIEDLGYYNVSLHRYVTEPGVYDVCIGSSSQDIRIAAKVLYDADLPYSMRRISDSMMG
ncbi:MAG: glycoside hydrolase family 3 C-terminal domain-containing protein [Eubacteriales bacterium]|nr:glycoside hydrolase family 3 C-terminal domain-containing protein [Eubacteriales bacterium]